MEIFNKIILFSLLQIFLNLAVGGMVLLIFWVDSSEALNIPCTNYKIDWILGMEIIFPSKAIIRKIAKSLATYT